jgi:hypothetical protein
MKSPYDLPGNDNAHLSDFRTTQNLANLCIMGSGSITAQSSGADKTGSLRNVD